MRKLRCLVHINKHADSDWGALVADLPGCVATGNTIDAALGRIEKKIELHLRGCARTICDRRAPRQRAGRPRRTRRQVDFYAMVEVAA